MLRRTFLTAVALVLVLGLPGVAQTRTVVDSAGRTVEVPEAPQRVLAAGPPASVLLYALAPEKMVGWVREPSPEEKAFLAAPWRDLPAYGRLTGRGNTANIEMVLSMRPDLILDVGSVDETYASLADRVQEQTGIPYVLLDGSFARTPETLREVGALLGVPDRAEGRPPSPSRRSRGWRQGSPRSPGTSAPASTTGAALTGSRPGSRGRSTWRCSARSERRTSRRGRAPAGSPTFRSSSCSPGTRT